MDIDCEGIFDKTASYEETYKSLMRWELFSCFCMWHPVWSLYKCMGTKKWQKSECLHPFDFIVWRQFSINIQVWNNMRMNEFHFSCWINGSCKCRSLFRNMLFYLSIYMVVSVRSGTSGVSLLLTIDDWIYISIFTLSQKMGLYTSRMDQWPRLMFFCSVQDF